MTNIPPYKPLDVDPNSQEAREEPTNRAKRLQALPALIAKETDRDRRAWLMQEEQFYLNDGKYYDWHRFKQHLQAKERVMHEEYKKQEQARLAFEAEKKRLDAEAEKRLREQYELETDPFEAWKRSKSERTF